ncbi:MAG: hypothetical protein ACJAY4_002179 [Cryomorphaceae bacterium]|jgi:hypothetical protein
MGYNYAIGNDWDTSYCDLSDRLADSIGGAYAQYMTASYPGLRLEILSRIN